MIALRRAGRAFLRSLDGMLVILLGIDLAAVAYFAWNGRWWVMALCAALLASTGAAMIADGARGLGDQADRT